jgi:hypothetical protein
MKAIQATDGRSPVRSAALAPATAAAQAADAWHFDAALYLYLPSVDGTTKFGHGRPAMRPSTPRRSSRV